MQTMQKLTSFNEALAIYNEVVKIIHMAMPPLLRLAYVLSIERRDTSSERLNDVRLHWA
jgi:hypothetical protein